MNFIFVRYLHEAHPIKAKWEDHIYPFIHPYISPP